MLANEIAFRGVRMFTTDVLKKFDLNGPRYTSYPTADRLRADFSAEDYARALTTMRREPASLYVHIPFCRSLCYYCACNNIISNSATIADEYLSLLASETSLVSKHTGSLPIVQIAFGGGTPNFLSLQQLERLTLDLTNKFELLAIREQSIELDPRFLDETYVAELPRLGFNRVSYGIQDFDEQVQTLINRHQSFEQTAQAVRAARVAGISSISFDLVYGLPIQTRERFARTLEQVLAMDPDRVALFNYAHIPERFKAQRLIPNETLPTIEQRTELFVYAMERLVDEGYEMIGLDHFAKPSDSLAKASSNGTLRRNFQGYSTHHSTDLIGLGVSAISQLNGVYAQNSAQLDVYRERILKQQLATARGIALDRDDEIRQAVIEQIMCDARVDWHNTASRFEIEPASYFAESREELAAMMRSGIVKNSADQLVVTSQGRLLLRAVAMVFDKYKHVKHEHTVTFSRIA
jgi:oxygen-independent coproporphyrinogen III oxidase